MPAFSLLVYYKWVILLLFVTYGLVNITVIYAGVIFVAQKNYVTTLSSVQHIA